MIKTKIITILAVLLMIFVVLTGCSSVKYNAKLFDNAIELISEDFISNNLVENLEDSSDLSAHTFIIKAQEEYDNIFIKNIDGCAVDFNNQMVVVYTFSTIYHRDNRLINLDVKEDVLKITYMMEKKSGVGDASQPYQRWFVVVLDKLDVSFVIFEEKK